MNIKNKLSLVLLVLSMFLIVGCSANVDDNLQEQPPLVEDQDANIEDGLNEEEIFEDLELAEEDVEIGSLI